MCKTSYDLCVKEKYLLYLYLYGLSMVHVCNNYYIYICTSCIKNAQLNKSRLKNKMSEVGQVLLVIVG